RLQSFLRCSIFSPCIVVRRERVRQGGPIPGAVQGRSVAWRPWPRAVAGRAHPPAVRVLQGRPVAPSRLRARSVRIRRLADRGRGRLHPRTAAPAYHVAMTRSDPIPTVRALLDQASAQLDPADAQLLLAHALGRDRAWLYAHDRDPVDPAARRRFADLVARRRAGEPVAYLRGRQGFWSLDLAVGPATLIPRPETERLVELALDRLPCDAPLALADLGTGSGAIALALAIERPRARVDAVDASDAAL